MTNVHPPALRIHRPLAVVLPLDAPAGAEPLSVRLERAGWKPGAPLIVTEDTQHCDAAVCRALACPACGRAGRRGLAYRPYCRGHRYRVLAECPRCKFQLEV